jgi:hypothetical protein
MRLMAAAAAEEEEVVAAVAAVQTLRLAVAAPKDFLK